MELLLSLCLTLSGMLSPLLADTADPAARTRLFSEGAALVSEVSTRYDSAEGQAFLIEAYAYTPQEAAAAMQSPESELLACRRTYLWPQLSGFPRSREGYRAEIGGVWLVQGGADGLEATAILEQYVHAPADAPYTYGQGNATYDMTLTYPTDTLRLAAHGILELPVQYTTGAAVGELASIEQTHTYYYRKPLDLRITLPLEHLEELPAQK